jgi:hypothetical protein
MVNFPTSLDALNNPTATTNRDDVGYEHHTQHANVNDICELLEAKLGIGSSTPVAGSVMRGSATGTSLWDTKLLLGAGSVSAPTFSYDGDPNTGEYNVSADILGVAAGGELVAQFKRTSAGLLGVRIGSGTFSETIGGDGDLFVKRGLNLGTAASAASGSLRASAGGYFSSITDYGLIQSQCAIANTGTLQALNSTSPIGLLFVTNGFDGQGAVFVMAGANAVTMIAGVAGTYTHTVGTANRANVYRDGGTGKVTIQNNLGSTVTFYCWAMTNSTAGGFQ